MSSARAAAIVTWGYALGFGLPTVPVSIYLLRNGQLPSFAGLFEMYGGSWSARASDRTFVVLLLLFGATTLVVAWSAWLLWQRRRIGAVLNLAVLPVEAVFWIGFALPLPWVTGLTRAILIAAAWNSLWLDVLPLARRRDVTVEPCLQCSRRLFPTLIQRRSLLGIHCRQYRVPGSLNVFMKQMEGRVKEEDFHYPTIAAVVPSADNPGVVTASRHDNAESSPTSSAEIRFRSQPAATRITDAQHTTD